MLSSHSGCKIQCYCDIHIDFGPTQSVMTLIDFTVTYSVLSLLRVLNTLGSTILAVKLHAERSLQNRGVHVYLITKVNFKVAWMGLHRVHDLADMQKITPSHHKKLWNVLEWLVDQSKAIVKQARSIYCSLYIAIFFTGQHTYFHTQFIVILRPHLCKVRQQIKEWQVWKLVTFPWSSKIHNTNKSILKK